MLSCNKDEEAVFPITNDLRVLKVSIGNKTVGSGETDVSVIGEMEFVFSHSLNTTAFEQALSITPAAELAITYDDTKSFAAIGFSKPLTYETSYSFRLPKGAYGAKGEASIEDYVFEFTTAAFKPPGVTLSADVIKFFEGEKVVITATLDRAIIQEVSMDLVFGGSAEQGTDYTTSAAGITIPSGSTSGSVELTALNDADLEGEETITVAIENLVNATQTQPQEVNLSLGDLPPALEIKGTMSLKIGGTSVNGRAVHLRALEDMADLSEYGIGIANNGGGSDGREIDFPAIGVTKGDDILLARDIDVSGLAAYFGDCYNDFDHVVESGDVNFNGDDPFELYQGDIVIETYGDVELDGTGLEWEWTGTWAYKLNGVWEYGQIDCAANSITSLESDCPYPFCVPLQLQGVSALLWDGSGTNGGKFVQVRANRSIPDLSRFGLGVANNGGGTDGIEFGFPQVTVDEGDQILVAREPETIAAYFGACYNRFDHVFQADAMSQNGDDAIELFDGMTVIETYGDANVDGTGQVWDYAGSWAFKAGGAWTYGGIDCAAGSTSTQSSACPYAFCE